MNELFELTDKELNELQTWIQKQSRLFIGKYQNQFDNIVIFYGSDNKNENFKITDSFALKHRQDEVLQPNEYTISAKPPKIHKK